jgi:LysR family glycine cleavage system transcriptional activator
MRGRLPSLNALRAFEAAGRHLSFTRAADELNVTPAAVGQQVKLLERDLGVYLFERLNRALALTAAGQALLPGTSDAFARLRDAIEVFRRRGANRPLTVSVPPSFGAKWLLPRLDLFRSQYPTIDIRIYATGAPVDLVRDDVDLAFQYGVQDDPAFHVDCLLDEEVFPVCSPRLLEGSRALSSPRDLRLHTLLHIDSYVSADYWPDWPMWLGCAGVKDVDAGRGTWFSQTSLALEAAIEGQGVALGSRVLAGKDLANGRLVKPFEGNYPVAFGYYMYCLKGMADEPRIAAFRTWMLAEAEASNVQLVPADR